MQFTVKNVLAIPLLKSAKLLSGEKIISSQIIKSVSVMEIPVENFVGKNEFVLTTAIGCGNNTELFLSYVREVFESGAAAMGIAVGRHVPYVPEEIIDFCNNHDFPLIELPWELRFSEILKTVLEQINRWEQTSHLKADSIQRELLKLFLDHESVDYVLKYLSKDFQMGVELKRKRDFTEPNLLEAIDLDTEEPTIIRHVNGSFTQVVPIKLLGKDTYFLLLKSKKLNAQPIPWLVLNQVVTILTLWIQKEITLADNKQKEMDDYLKDLTNGNWINKEKFIDEGKKLGFVVDVPYVCIVGQPEKLDEYYSSQKKKNSAVEKEFKHDFTMIINELKNKVNKQIILTFHREVIVIFLECSLEKVNHEVNDFLDLLNSYVEEMKIPVISWGIGENHAGVMTFHYSYKNARTALEVGRSHKGTGSRSTFASTGIYQLLISLQNNTFSTELMHSTIGSIASYDKNNGLDLLRTLSSYIYHQGNVSQTARALSLHRQSLLYRLRKIETLTNRSLSDPDDIFLLQFCLKLWEVRFENSEPYIIAK
ncbi:purine catabolism regulatory protein [Lysinibacillus sp. PLM2]|nr:purine catabolism regulatory protein [Lysinibacillus sp. PLM2]